MLALESKILLARLAIGIMAIGYFILGMYIAWQQNMMNECNYLMTLSIEQLMDIRVRG